MFYLIELLKKEPFFNKGRGRSLMTSDFIVQHPSGLFFELSDEQLKRAAKKYPSLKEPNLSLNFAKNGASAFIALDGKNNFDSDTILYQFNVFSKLLEFKEDFKDHDIEFLVDNATTHTKISVDINKFSKS